MARGNKAKMGLMMKFRELLSKENDLVLAIVVTSCLFAAFVLSSWLFFSAQARLIADTETQTKRQFADFLYSTEPKRLPVPVVMPKKKIDAKDLTLNDAEAAVIIDVQSGEILFGKNENTKRAIASTTKILTAMVLVDQVRDRDLAIEIPEDVLSIEGTRVGCKSSYICEGERLRAGEKVRIKDLIQAMLIASANDAATVLARYVAETEEDFAILMNARMDELGLGESNFCRPSGLELDDVVLEQQCHSSARDIGRVLATVVREPKYQEIEEMLATKKATFTSEDGTITHEVESTNDSIELSQLIVGGKTGFTPRAGLALANIGEDENGNNPVVTVVLDDPQRFETSLEMLEWVYSSFEWVTS